MTIEELLKDWRRSAFEWGKTDCLLSVGRYIAANGGDNVAASYEGRYSTEDDALRLMTEAGGAAGLIDATGLERVAEPRRGDVVVINVARGIAGVHTGNGVAVRLERGVAEIDLRFVQIFAAWRINCAS